MIKFGRMCERKKVIIKLSSQVMRYSSKMRHVECNFKWGGEELKGVAVLWVLGSGHNNG